jgi:hypothetical protein
VRFVVITLTHSLPPSLTSLPPPPPPPPPPAPAWKRARVGADSLLPACGAAFLQAAGSDAAWRVEYMEGTQFEIYRIPLSSAYDGMLYSEVPQQQLRFRASRYTPVGIAFVVVGGGLAHRARVVNGVNPTVVSQAVRRVYTQLGLVVFALELFSPQLEKERLVLNPVGFTIPDVTLYQVHVYVIAEDKKAADAVTNLVGA